MDVRLLTTWDEPCGVAEYSRLLVQALRRRAAVEVVPATFRPCPKTTYAAMGRALSDGDVAHVQHSYAFFGGMHPLRSGWAALAASVTRPMLLTVHELDSRPTGAYRLPPVVESAYKQRFNRSVFLHPAVRGWMVHSVELRDALVGLGAPAERVLYRPLPVDVAPKTSPDPAPVRRSLRLEGTRALVIVGFLVRRKGYEVALEALRRLPREWVLVAAGGEHPTDRSQTAAWLQAEAERLGVAERLRITGYLPDAALEGVTALADAVLAPFREMSASASLNYALARRKLVIASDLPENRALNCVRLFPAGDGAALAAAVQELAADETERRRLLRSVDRYVREHSYDALAEATVQRYQELLRERGAAKR